MSWETGFDRRNVLVESKCPEIDTECDKLIILDIKVFSKIFQLLKEYPDFEWCVYMIGEETEEAYQIEDVLLMKQEVTAGTVELIDEQSFPEKCIGWLHSHAHSNVFLSEEDLKTSLLYKLTVVVNNELEFYSRIKKKLPCGKFGLIPIKLKINGIELDTSNITEKKYEYAKKPESWSPRKIERFEVTDKKKQCVVCGQKLGKKKKQTLCSSCGNYVHLKCFDYRENQCLNCIKDELIDDEETEDGLIKEYNISEFNISEYDYDKDSELDIYNRKKRRGGMVPYEDY